MSRPSLFEKQSRDPPYQENVLTPEPQYGYQFLRLRE